MFHVEQKKIHIKTKDFFLTKEVFSIIKTEQEGLLITDPFPPKEVIQKYYKVFCKYIYSGTVYFLIFTQI